MMKRLFWVDNAKAIGIFCILLSHQHLSFAIIVWLFSFHVPLFFLLSGLLFDPSRHAVFRDFAYRKFRTILVPYFIFATCSYLFWLLLCEKPLYSAPALLLKYISILYGVGVGGWQVPLGVMLWFLPCLFVVEMVSWAVIRFLGGKQRVWAVAAFVLSGYFFSCVQYPFRFPFGIEIAFTGAAFYLIGFMAKDAIAAWISGKSFIGSLALVLLGSVGFSQLNGYIDMNTIFYGNPIFFYIAAICGSLSVIGLGRLLGDKAMLRWIGAGTIVIMGFNGITGVLLKFLLDYGRHVLGWDWLTRVPILIFVLVQMILLVPFILIVNRYSKIILGRG